MIAYLLVRRDRIDLGSTATQLLGTLLGLHAFLLIRTLASGQLSGAGQLIFDLLILPVQLVAALVLLRERRDLVWLAWIGTAGAAVFALLAIAGVGSPEKYGHGWAPLGSPITFQRVEITGFFAALYLFWLEQERRVKVLLLGLAALSLFASLASLLKAGVIAAVAGVGFLIARDLARGARRSALVTALVALASFLLFFALRGSLIGARTFEAFDQRQSISVESETRVAGLVAEEVGRISAGLDPRAASEFRRKCDPEQVREKLQSGLMFLPQSEEEYLCSQVVTKALYPEIPRPEELFVFADRSHRVRLIARALLDFSQSPWWGNGLGKYRFVTTTSYDPEPKTYSYPHNVILEFLAGTGIVGTSALIVALTCAVFLLERARVFAEPERFWYAAAVTVLVSAQFAGDYFDFRLVWLFCLLALTITDHHVSKVNRSPG